MDLIVLGCSGSYGSPGLACSGYLVRSGDTTVALDCGNGSFALLQEHVDPMVLDAVVLTHEHPDHCVDLYGLHVLLRYGLERTGLPVYAPSGLAGKLGALVSDWGDVFSWHEIDEHATVGVGELELGFSRTDHPPPTYAVEVRAEGRRLVYTSDTGPGWSPAAFGPGADVVLTEATYLHDHRPSRIHLSAREAGEAARGAEAGRVVLTHLWPKVDRVRAVEEASDAFGDAVTLAAPHLVTRV